MWRLARLHPIYKLLLKVFGKISFLLWTFKSLEQLAKQATWRMPIWFQRVLSWRFGGFWKCVDCFRRAYWLSRIAEVQSTWPEEVLFGPVGLGLEDFFLTWRHISDSVPSNSSSFNMENEVARHNHPRGPWTLFLWRKGWRKEVRTSSFLIGDLVHWTALVHWTSHEQQPSSNFSFSFSFYCSYFLVIRSCNLW